MCLFIQQILKTSHVPPNILVWDATASKTDVLLLLELFIHRIFKKLNKTLHFLWEWYILNHRNYYLKIQMIPNLPKFCKHEFSYDVFVVVCCDLLKVEGMKHLCILRHLILTATV